jgi:thiopurine S-methyltransferase
MDHQFWHQRWRDNLIGFHQSSVNPHLQRHWRHLGVAHEATVFVPLCGKSLDMLWLAEHYRVLGVELSLRAVEDFFREQGLEPECRRSGAFRVCEAMGVRLYCGDFFALQPSQLAGIAAVYDRAALIALPPAQRVDYAARLTALAPAGTRMLLVSMEYPQAQMDGPPFSVEADEVAALFGNDWQVESLEQHNVLEQVARFRERGLTRLAEHVWRLTRR